MSLPRIDFKITGFKRLAGIISITLLCLFCFSSCNEKSKHGLRFAFIGDIHYAMPDYRTADYLVPSISRELDSMKVKPEFVIHT